MSDAFGDWPLRRLLTEVMGSGPNSADDMTYDQAHEGMVRVLGADPDPTTLGAFLLANRWKRNTPEELAGFLDAMRERSVQVAEPSTKPVDCGANYDGKVDTALLGVAAGVTAAAAGTPVVVHSGGRIPATCGAVYRHVLDELGVPTALEPAESAAMVEATGFGFYDQRRFNPGVHGLLDRREALGVRSFLNTIETLANPANAAVHLGSFFHRSFPEKIIETFRESRTLSVDRVVMVRGLEGYDDARPERTTVVEYRDGELTDFDLDADSLGLSASTAALEVDDVAVDSARLTEAVLTGDAGTSVTDAVALNAGLRLFAASETESVAQGVDRARATIESGRATAVLQRLRDFETAIDGGRSRVGAT